MIETDVPESPGWWLQRLAKKLQGRQERLTKLDAYLRGDPPLPVGAKNAQRAYQAFQRQARANYARMVVEAPRQRMKPLGFRTGAEGDENGDAVAREICRENGLWVEFPEVLRSMLGLGDGYMIVGRDEATGRPVITAESPFQVVTEHDPRQQRRVLAAVKLFRDDVSGTDFAYLYLPGRLRVARREVRRAAGSTVRFTAATWDWDENLSGDLPAGFEDVMPVVRFRNERGIGEFEEHLDSLDRINHQILQRMVITTVQAFKQRAIKADKKSLPDNYPEGHPLAGQPIDYDDMFAADPGALWRLPESAEIWESGQADIRPILDAVKDDVRELAAVTFTTHYSMNPDSANQTAEGASTQREGLVFKTEDRIIRATDGLVQVMQLAFRYVADSERANPSALEVIWSPVERHSLAEKYDAASKAPAGMPLQTIMTEILQFTPDLANRVLQQRADEVNAAVRAQITEALRLQTEQGLSQAASFAAVGLIIAANQIRTDQTS